MSVFDSQKLLEGYYKTGQFPKIHDDIFFMVENYAGDTGACIDLGCCTGLLSVRMAKEGRKSLVIGVEPNNRYLMSAVSHPSVIYKHMGINYDTFDAFTELVDLYNVKLVVARRVFPEIYDTGGIGLVKDFAHVLYKIGIEKIILEGRIPVASAKNTLSNADLECVALGEYYQTTKAYKNCRLLLRR